MKKLIGILFLMIGAILGLAALGTAPRMFGAAIEVFSTGSPRAIGEMTFYVVLMLTIFLLTRNGIRWLRNEPKKPLTTAEQLDESTNKSV